MSQFQVGVNAAATRNLAETFGRWGLEDVQRKAEAVVAMLLHDGLKPIEVEKVPPMKPGPGASETSRRHYVAEIQRILAEKRAAHRAEAMPSRPWQHERLTELLIADGVADSLSQAQWVEAMVGRSLGGMHEVSSDEAARLISSLTVAARDAEKSTAELSAAQETPETLPEPPAPADSDPGPVPYDDEPDELEM